MAFATFKVIPQYFIAHPTRAAQDFRVISARKWARARAQRNKIPSQAKLDNEVNARFLLNEHGDPYFLV